MPRNLRRHNANNTLVDRIALKIYRHPVGRVFLICFTIYALISALLDGLRDWWRARSRIIPGLRAFVIAIGHLLHGMCFPVTVYSSEELWYSDELKVCIAAGTVCSSFVICLVHELYIYPDVCIFNLLSEFVYFILTRDAPKTFLLCAFDFCCTTVVNDSRYGAGLVFLCMGFWTFIHYNLAAPHPIWTAGRCAVLGLFAYSFRAWLKPLSAFSFLVAALYYFCKFVPKFEIDYLLFFPAISTLRAIMYEWRPNFYFAFTYMPFLFWLFARFWVE